MPDSISSGAAPLPEWQEGAAVAGQGAHDLQNLLAHHRRKGHRGSGATLPLLEGTFGTVELLLHQLSHRSVGIPEH